MNFPDSLSSSCFALLDDSGASDVEPRSRLYTGYLRSLSCSRAEALPEFFAALEQALAEGLHAVGLFSYELGAEMYRIEAYPQAASDAFPSQVLLFSECSRLSEAQVASWLDARVKQLPADSRTAGVAQLRPGISAEQFEAAIAAIHDYQRRGHTYQVNFTYRLHFESYGASLALYARLRARQPVPYGACIALPDGSAVLSFSPELFVRHQAGTLTVRPMKGTAPASGEAQIDQARASALAADEKNRAENLMIVDLLRNDLGRVAVAGSVRVDDLFQVQRFGSVLQMTSTIRAEATSSSSLAHLFAALFPCGSITGAPKRRTMEIIRELEAEPRGIYTGAIGWFDAPAPGKSVPDFCLSVPIRTLHLHPGQAATSRGVMGVGAGIVYDSDSASEYAECALKAGFLTGLDHQFELFETMQASRARGCPYLERHLQRLSGSAHYFGFACDQEQIRQEVAAVCAALPEGLHRLRLALDREGAIKLQTGLMAAVQEPVKLLLAASVVSTPKALLRHKTTVRHEYDAGWKNAEAQGAFDTLFFNADGELTEGGRSSIFLKLDGRWYTPPVESGLLPGVMRSVLLDDPAWNARERPLRLEDLQAAQEIVVCNALRGPLRACVDGL